MIENCSGIDVLKYAEAYTICSVPSSERDRQSDEVFSAIVDGKNLHFSMHNYGEMYKIPNLYDAMMYGLLRCETPFALAREFGRILFEHRADPSTLRVLEVGAGSGAFAEAVRLAMPIGRMVGLDIIEEARVAAERDRPGIYDGYIVADLCALSWEAEAEIASLSPNCVGVASATGWNNHIPVAGFERAFSVLEPGGWFIFHVKPNDPDPECVALLQWIEAKVKTSYIVDSKRGRIFHRMSVNGEKIYYDYVVGRKQLAR
ncbi:MAG: class I SAM-dependent methyltransferase [Mesorhizobium sp.]|uniref:class I SAM-dependent DNA methyltransferase n=1 Tax=Mesorhizobium sp. TaxID=1871066 RepID=UPI000FEAB068|nr:class I SAM-dependent methyltransferase [Mesorhizobium sp.]RWD58094.1 MAG: class I SAM-dependent methyltransferase [Mesorhizobium sp.]RWE31569.1 MAG: class I SAM-dependent methyltransferase [Mesorhizobium sp.]